jgi:integrase
MGIGSRNKQSLSWAQAEQITDYISRMDKLGDSRRQQYSTLILSAAASGLRCGELLALRVDDIDFDASTIRVDESSDQRNGGAIGPCKNVAAYRTVHLGDAEGRKTMAQLRRFLNPLSVWRPWCSALAEASHYSKPPYSSKGSIQP